MTIHYNVRDGRTDTTYYRYTALCVASRGKKLIKPHHSLVPTWYYWIEVMDLYKSIQNMSLV